MNTITFRSAKLDDLPILYSFEQGIITAERPYDETLKQGHINYYDIKEMIESDNVEVIVATLNDEILASAYVKIVNAQAYFRFKQYAYLGFMFVKPEHRGKGLSQQLIEQCVLWAKSRNLTELKLEVYGENIRAVKAYEKAGLKKDLVEMRMTI